MSEADSINLCQQPQFGNAASHRRIVVSPNTDNTTPYDNDMPLIDSKYYGIFMLDWVIIVSIVGSTDVSPSDQLFLPSNVLDVYDESALAEFLKDIMLPCSDHDFDYTQSIESAAAPMSGPKNLLDFGLHVDMQLDETDFGTMDFYNGRKLPGPISTVNDPPLAMPSAAKGDDIDLRSSDRLAIGTEAFQRSLWSWTPTRNESSVADQTNFTLLREDTANSSAQTFLNMNVTSDTIDNEARDKIIAMILGTCDRTNFLITMTSFPSAEIMNNLMHSFLVAHLCKCDSWLHLPTLKIKTRTPEFIATLISAGAVHSSSLTIQRVGFAMDESVRMSIQRKVGTNRRMQ